jgi:sigma-B regulation protein RsbU (phosphoserine phosphatase)
MPPRDGADPEAAAFDEAACALMRTTDDGTFLYANRTFCVWVGYPREELIGRRRLQDLLTMGGRIFHQTHWSPLLRMQGSLAEVKLELLHQDGNRVPMMLNARRHQLDGVFVHELAAFVAHDRDRYEQELVRARKRLEAAVADANRLGAEAKDRAQLAEQMIGIVSHDLRNPLSAIQTGLAVLADAELSAPQERVVRRMTRATAGAHRLILDLLDFAQARLNGRLAVAPVAIDLHRVIADAVDELRLVHPERTLVHVRVGDGGCTLDPGRIAQAAGNLVSNAVAYGDQARPITITSAITAEAALVAVHNAGQPIPADVRDGLFAPMTRGAHAGGNQRSVGLGLFIVREIARAHGGDVDVTSTADDGTTFTLRLAR